MHLAEYNSWKGQQSVFKDNESEKRKFENVSILTCLGRDMHDTVRENYLILAKNLSSYILCAVWPIIYPTSKLQIKRLRRFWWEFEIELSQLMKDITLWKLNICASFQPFWYFCIGIVLPEDQ